MYNKKQRVKLFTHTDLDGVGCAIIGKLNFDNIDITYCDYHNVDRIVKDFFTNHEYINYDNIFITDISVDKEVAEIINDTEDTHVVLLDHHKTAEWLNVYSWAHVSPQMFGIKNSGTNMFHRHLMLNGAEEDYREPSISMFVEKVRRYDTWDWKNVYEDHLAGELNQLLYLLGRDEFVNNIMNKFNASQLTFADGEWLDLFSEADKYLIKADNNKKNAYIESKARMISVTSYKGYTVGYVFGEQYISELGNALSEMFPECSFIAIIDLGKSKVSLRTKHTDIDLGRDVARDFGGGGHPQASGFELSLDLTHDIIESIFAEKQDELTKPKMLNRIIDKIFKK